MKVVVNFIYGYQNQEKNTKPVKKELAQSAIPVMKKSQKPPENTVFQKSDISGSFLDFSPNW